MPIEAGDAVWRITGNIDGVKDAMAQAQGAVTQGLGEMQKAASVNFAEIGRLASTGMIVAGGAITGFAALCIKEFAESEKAAAQLDAVLKSTGGAAGMTRDSVLGLAESLQSLTAYDDDTILSAENLMLTFTSISKDVFPQAIATVLDMSAALGQDLKGSTIQLGKALQDPIQGISALQRVGVNFNDTQKEQIKLMVESGNIMGAQKLILAELAKEFGGSAAAEAQTFAGQLKQLKNEAMNLAESLGGPLVNSLRGMMVDFKPYLDGLAQAIRDHPQATELIMKTVTVLGLLSLGLGTLYKVILPFQVLLPLLTGAQGFGGLGAGVSSLAGLLGPGGVLVLAIGATIASLTYLGVKIYEHIEATKILEQAKMDDAAATQQWADYIKATYTDYAGYVDELMAWEGDANVKRQKMLEIYTTAVKQAKAEEVAANREATEEVVGGTQEVAAAYEEAAQVAIGAGAAAHDGILGFSPYTQWSPSLIDEVQAGLFSGGGVVDLYTQAANAIWGILDGLREAWAGITGAVGNAWNSVSGAFGGYMSQGGAVAKGEIYEVGEEGPELVYRDDNRANMGKFLGLSGRHKWQAPYTGTMVGTQATQDIFSLLPDFVPMQDMPFYHDEIKNILDSANVPYADARAQELAQHSGKLIADLRAFGWRAEGGDVTAGKPYVVGEKGPEIFVPKQGGEVISNANAGRMGNVTLNVNVSQMVVREEADIDRISQKLAEKTRAGLAELGWATAMSPA